MLHLRYGRPSTRFFRGLILSVALSSVLVQLEAEILRHSGAGRTVTCSAKHFLIPPQSLAVCPPQSFLHTRRFLTFSRPKTLHSYTSQQYSEQDLLSRLTLL